MKITKTRLKQIIQEELTKVLNEGGAESSALGDALRLSGRIAMSERDISYDGTNTDIVITGKAHVESSPYGGSTVRILVSKAIYLSPMGGSSTRFRRSEISIDKVAGIIKQAGYSNKKPKSIDMISVYTDINKFKETISKSKDGQLFNIEAITNTRAEGGAFTQFRPINN